MLRSVAAGCFLLLSFFVCAQKSEITVSIPAEIKGGKQALEQVLETQLQLPKTLLQKSFETEITAYFEIDNEGKAIRTTFNKQINNVLRQELIRMLRFLRFVKKTGINETPYEYSLIFELSTAGYNQYIKQKTKSFIKQNLVADTSFIVYTKADVSPDYYKNGEEGLVEFIERELEYPSVAREKSIEGTVEVDFIVEANGFPGNFEIKKGVSGGCTEEALRVLSKTKWQPAQLNGKFVRYKMHYPITFRLISSINNAASPY